MSTFYICDWSKDFFPSIYNFTKSKTNNNLQKSLLILPTGRSRQVCVEYFQSEEKSTLLPEFMTITDLLKYCQLAWLDNDTLSARIIDTLESIYILYEIVSELANSEGEHSESKFFSSLLFENSGEDRSFFHKELENFHHFYQYGVHLHNIIQECFEEDTANLSLQNTSDTVEDFIAYLLENLKVIIIKYQKRLTEKKLTTKEYLKYLLAQKIKNESHELKRIFNDKTLVFCGLDRVGASEEIILNYFLGQETYFLFCTDSNLVTNRANSHWSTGIYQEWANRWKADFSLINFENAEVKDEVKYFFYQSFDVHSQFQELNLDKNAHRTACIMNSQKSLMPLIYTLNRKFSDEELNITMGYPLSETKIFSFLQFLDRIKNNHRVYHDEKENTNILITYEDCFEFLSFPFFTLDFGEVLNISDKIDIPYIDPCAYYPHLKELFEDVLYKWFNVSSLNDITYWCRTFSRYVFNNLHNDNVERYVVSKMYEICDTWKEKEYANMTVGYQLSLRIFNEKISNESVPFLHHSDDALQVLGLLETKNLQYKEVHIFDANDEFLPAKTQENPLLPEKFRSLLALPSMQIKEMPLAHTWYRLIAGAEIVHLYWQESTAKGLFDSKKIRSPYVEEILWNVEQKREELFDIAVENKEFTQSQCSVEIPQREHTIPVTDEIRKRLNLLLKRSISATMLDTFLACPLRFFYQYLCSFKEGKELKEEESSKTLGNFIHYFLQKFYEEGKTVDKAQLQHHYEEEIIHIDNYLHNFKMDELLPAESLLLLKKSFPYRMEKYIENQPDSTKIFKLESKFEASLGKDFKLKGYIDRIDERDDETSFSEKVIIDYKTGYLKKMPDSKFWESGIETIADFCENPYYNDEYHKIISFLYKNMESTQLILYIYLLHKNNIKVKNAGYVEFYDSCEEKFIFSEKENKSEIIEKNIPLLLTFLAKYIKNIEVFSKHEKTTCDYCQFEKYCQ